MIKLLCINLFAIFVKYIELEQDRFPLFLPAFLGFGILFGVYFPQKIFIAVLTIILISFFLKVWLNSIRLIPYLATLIIGIYVSQTGGILKTGWLTDKQFIENDCDKISFFANINFIEETHPTMKGMQRVILKDMTFNSKYHLDFIKTAKMTCHSKMLKDININDRVKVFGRLLKYKTAAIPGSFDQKQYNSLIKIDTTGVIFSIKRVGNSDVHQSKKFFSKIRRNLTTNIMKKMSFPANGIAAALLTGDKSAITPDIREKFIKSGTAHILAISGLHMSIIATILFFLFSKLISYVALLIRNINFQIIAAILTIATTFLYLGLSGFSPSALRAFIMTTICLISKAFGKAAISLRNVSAAALLILLFDPASLFLVSFQLSFCAVVSLISFYESYRTKLNITNMNIINRFLLYIMVSIITTFIASIATLPVSISTFNKLSLVGILGNLVAIPTISFLVAPLGIACIIFSKIFSFLPKILESILNLLVNIIGYISELPGADLTLRSPHTLSLYICVIGGIIFCLLKTKLRYCGTFMMILSFVIYLFESSPNVIVPPGTSTICFVENGNFYTTSLRSGRNKILAVQRNLGFSGKLIKREKSFDNIESKIYEQGLFVWTKSGKITKRYQIAKRQHPYCPAYFEEVKNE